MACSACWQPGRLSPTHCVFLWFYPCLVPSHSHPGLPHLTPNEPFSLSFLPGSFLDTVGALPEQHGVQEPLAESLGHSLSLLSFCTADFPVAQLPSEPHPTSQPPLAVLVWATQCSSTPIPNTAFFWQMWLECRPLSGPSTEGGRGFEAQDLPVKTNRTIIFNQSSLL